VRGDLPEVVGVCGAGTMGAGIAQVAVGCGMRTLLFDPLPEALERGAARVREGIARWRERGRLSPEQADGALELLEPVGDLEALAPCELVIEAAPERLDLKHDLFRRLSAIVDEQAVLATNTSSIPVTEIARAATNPERVCGMHFFNPAPLMRLLEVIAADQTGERALAVAFATGREMGKHVILAQDGPGFLVNRCGRPFNGEALRCLQERLATHEQIDRIVRLGGGFRMGPFELMDLVGVDTGFAVAKSFTELSFGEPRWRPSTIQARLVAAGRLGRKTGRGFYDYSHDPYRPPDPEPLEPGGGEGTVLAIVGEGAIADALRERARRAGFDVRGDGPAEVAIYAGLDPAPKLRGGAPTAVLLAGPSLAARGETQAVGFHLVPPVDGAQLVELAALPTAAGFAREAVERTFRSLGFHSEWVEDSPGLVLGRIVSQLINEAAFALGEGVGSPDDVDAGLELGLNHPRGPVRWSEEMGADHALAVIDALYDERREERYRAAPLLRRAVALGRSLRELAS